MNALWITRMCVYKNSAYRIQTARQLIAVKIYRQRALLAAYKKKFRESDLIKTCTLRDVLLLEARAAKIYWREFGALLLPSTPFLARSPRAHDIANRLLDIGYRYYMELQVLKFIKAVNHGEVYKPLSLPTRHDTRCSNPLTPA